MAGDKTTVYASSYHVGSQVQMLVNMGYTRIGVQMAADGVFDVEGYDRKGTSIADRVRGDREVLDALPEIKRLRNLMTLPKVKAALDIIIKEAER